ncbi:proton-coupled folate transporter [Patella vulgata]|uniref:proton-coupled folate transporter n=1 Tax=Patella vulgata TaxID=6465 RepID=UPI00217F507A|nr:proton-coupled folate transporter [Patella vulgata]
MATDVGSEYRSLLRHTSDDGLHNQSERNVGRLRCLVIETVVFLFFVAHGIAIPINVFYAHSRLQTQRHGKNYTCELFGNHTSVSNDTKGEQDEMTQFMMYNKVVNVIGIIPAIFFGPIVDKVGRKVGILIPTIGILGKAIFFYLFISLDLSMYYLLIGCGIENISGGYAVMLLSCFGIIADITPPGKVRTYRIAVIEALQAVTTSVAIVTTGFWIQNHDFRNPMILSAAASVCLLCLVLTVVPETLEITSGLTCSPGLFLRCCSVYMKSKYFKERRWMMVAALVCFILTVSVNFTKSNIQQMVLMYAPFCWGEVKLTLYVSAGLIVCWFAILVVSKLLQTLFNLQDLSLGIVGCISSIASLFIFSFASTDTFAYAATGAGVFIRLIIPMIRSFSSRHVLLKEQGALFAGFAAVEVVTAAVAGSLSDYIYSKTFSFFRGFIFVCMAVFMIVTLGLLVLLRVKTKDEVASGYRRLPEDECPYERIN